VNLLADESVDRQIVERLRQDGYRVMYVAETGPGMPDGDVLALASREEALLLTADKDFGEIVYRQRLHTHGIVLIRLAGLPPEHKAEVVALAIREHAEELEDAFTVIAPGACRIRRSVG
jgi:predicted nuclease of predicted toxin-antitoxin system